MRDNKIVIKGAKAHNLKNVDLELERDQLIVFTGLIETRIPCAMHTQRRNALTASKTNFRVFISVYPPVLVFFYF